MRGVVLIGASTGAPRIHHIYLRQVPRDLIAPIVIIQHMPRGPFVQGMMKYLQEEVRLRCKFAQDRARLEPRTVYLVEPGFHLRFLRGSSTMSVQPAAGENFFAPSMDVTFTSAAGVFGALSCIAITSGLHAEHDGVEGCQAVRRAGGRVLLTTPETTPCYHMIKQIRAVGEYDAEAPLERILGVMNDWIREQSHATI